MKLYDYGDQARAPMGLTSSGDEFCSRTDHALVGITGMYKLVDNILIYGNTESQLIERIEEVLKRCEEHKITLSNSTYNWAQK